MTAFPKPAVALYPILSFGTVLPTAKAPPPSVLDAGWHVAVTSGRMAIALALEQLKLAPGDEVLVPALHCNAMVEPVVHAGGRPVFYRLHEDTSIHLEDIEARLTSRTRVVIATHYFGFPQNAIEMRRFCDARGLTLIEDCAHAFFGEYAGEPLGSYGDYAVASAMKFFPICDGGYLVSRRHRVDRISTRSSGWRFAAGAVKTIVGRSVHYGRLRSLRPLVAAGKQLRNAARRVPSSPEQAAGPRYGFDGYFSGAVGEFDPAWIHTSMSSPSRAIIALAGKAGVCEKRRANYRKLLQGLSDLPRCRALFPTLAASVVPFVFPLLVDETERVFPALKRCGIPILRFGEYLWPGLDRTLCPVTERFSRTLLQFPCHQELTPAELDWMIATIRRIVLET
jgi:dTDP-4-amino-4,6-dideoxygalactose transaminase